MTEANSGSLVRHREILQKISQQAAAIKPNRENSAMIQSIQNSSKQIQQGFEGRIEDSFRAILQAPTLMPLQLPLTNKDNVLAAHSSAVEGAKALMYHYWDRNRKSIGKGQNKSCSMKSLVRKEEKLPHISQVDYKMAALLRAKEKEQELGIVMPKEQPQEECHVKLQIIDFQLQNDSKNFHKFQKVYFKRWQEISSLLKALENFAAHYQLSTLTIVSKSVLALIDRLSRGTTLGTHDLLSCCENAEEISEKHSRKAGIRFFGRKGTLRAAILVQAHIRRWLAVRQYRRRVREWRGALKIQSIYRSLQLKRSFKEKIAERQQKKIDAFKAIQKQFEEDFPIKSRSGRTRYEIHVPSLCYGEWEKLSMQKFQQRQNSELCRIFKVAEQGLGDLRVVYISPVPLSKEILSYYKKLLQLASARSLYNKITILSPTRSQIFPPNLSISQLLYYCSRTLRKIKSIVRDQFAYVVPSRPSNDFISICTALGIPLYSGPPQQLAYLSTKSGCKFFQNGLQAQGLGVLPYTVDIYSQPSLLNELTNLIFRYPYVKRWLLKIDCESHSRGIAHIDVSKILGKLFGGTQEGTSKQQEKAVREQIFGLLENSLVINDQERIIPLDKESYANQEEFLAHFYTKGGIIEASVNNFQGQIQNNCFVVDLPPNSEWTVLCAYRKVTAKSKAVAAYFDNQLIKPPPHIEGLVRKLKQQKLFGYFTFEFMSIDSSLEKSMKKQQDKIYYLNSVNCGLDAFSSAHFLRKLVSPQSNALYVPLLQHPMLQQLRIQTFFQLCRLENISFDIGRKVGNVFTFLDGLESGCLGMMTFHQASQQDCYAHAAEVLEFLNSKLVQQNRASAIPASFLSLKNAIKGYLNRLRRFRGSAESRSRA